MAVRMPVTVVPRSLATDLIETFMTDESRVMRNWPDARIRRTDEPVRVGFPADAPDGSAAAGSIIVAT